MLRPLERGLPANKNSGDLSDGRCLRGGEPIGRGQRDERGDWSRVGVRVGASSSPPEREELEHRKGGNRRSSGIVGSKLEY